MRVTLRGLEWSSCSRACKSNTASSTTASFDCCSTRAGGGGRHTAGLLCLFASARQPQAFTIDPRLYLFVTRLAQHLALHPRLNIVFPFCVGHKEHLPPNRPPFLTTFGPPHKGHASLLPEQLFPV